jgi:hypothetical protein
MLVGRRCRHVVLLIKVSVISPDHRQVGATDAVSTMSMIEQQQGRVWGIRSVTRPAVTWDVIEIQSAHQNQGGNPELPKSVERGRVRFILRDVVPTPLTPGETSMATLAEVRRLTSGAYPARSAMVSAQVQVIVGGGGSQRGRTPSRLLAKDAVELGVAAEAGT